MSLCWNSWPLWLASFFLSRQVRSLGVVFLSFLVVGEVAICVRNSGVDNLSRPEGCDLTAEGLEPYHENACVVDASYTFWTRSPWVPFSSFFMCPCVLLPPGRFGPLRAEVFVGSRRVRLVQALLSSPSSPGLVPCPLASAFLFFSLAFPGFARFGLGFIVLVFLLPSSFAFPSSRPG